MNRPGVIPTDRPLIRPGKGILRLSAGLLAAVLVVQNGVFAYATESEFWAARRRATRNARTLRPTPTFLARVPAGPAAPESLLPPPAKTTDWRPVETGDSGVPTNAPGTAALPKQMAQILQNHGSLRDVYISKQPRAPLVVHIQDLHDSLDAQRNTAAILEALSDARGLTLVGLEGAQGAFATQAFRNFPEEALARSLADYFLKEGLIGGAEYAGWTAPRPPTLWGVEDGRAYLENIESVRRSAKAQGRVGKILAQAHRLLTDLRDRKASAPFMALERHVEAYAEHREAVGPYVHFLLRQKGVDPLGYGNLRLLDDALAWESSIDFRAVDSERNRLLERLVHRLGSTELKTLMDESLRYRGGDLTYGEYYRGFQNRLTAAGLRLEDYPQLNGYIRYVLLSEKINRVELLGELATLERRAQVRAAASPFERSLVDLGRRYRLLDKLTRHALTPADWRDFQVHRLDLIGFSEELNRVAAEAGSTERVESLAGTDLDPFEDFCAQALARNAALVDSLLAKMESDHSREAVLVAGGFHTEGLTQRLREKGISYVVVTPRVNETLAMGSRALDVLARDPIPLERLFAGPTINIVTPRATAVESPGRYGRTLTGLAVALGLFLAADNASAAIAAQRLPDVAEVRVRAMENDGREIDLRWRNGDKTRLETRAAEGEAGGGRTPLAVATLEVNRNGLSEPRTIHLYAPADSPWKRGGEMFAAIFPIGVIRRLLGGRGVTPVPPVTPVVPTPDATSKPRDEDPIVLSRLAILMSALSILQDELAGTRAILPKSRLVAMILSGEYLHGRSIEVRQLVAGHLATAAGSDDALLSSEGVAALLRTLEAEIRQAGSGYGLLRDATRWELLKWSTGVSAPGTGPVARLKRFLGRHPFLGTAVIEEMGLPLSGPRRGNAFWESRWPMSLAGGALGMAAAGFNLGVLEILLIGLQAGFLWSLAPAQKKFVDDHGAQQSERQAALRRRGTILLNVAAVLGGSLAPLARAYFGVDASLIYFLVASPATGLLAAMTVHVLWNAAAPARYQLTRAPPESPSAPTPLGLLDRLPLLATTFATRLALYAEGERISEVEALRRVHRLSQYPFRDPLQNTANQMTNYYYMLIALSGRTNGHGRRGEAEGRQADLPLLRLVLLDRAVSLARAALPLVVKSTEKTDMSEALRDQIKWDVRLFAPLAASLPRDRSSGIAGMDLAAVMTDLVVFLENPARYEKTRRELLGLVGDSSRLHDVQQSLLSEADSLRPIGAPRWMTQARIKTVSSVVNKVIVNPNYSAAAEVKDIVTLSIVFDLVGARQSVATWQEWRTMVYQLRDRLEERLRDKGRNVTLTLPDEKEQGYIHFNANVDGVPCEMQFQTMAIHQRQEAGDRIARVGGQAHYVRKANQLMAWLGKQIGFAPIKLSPHRRLFEGDTEADFEMLFAKARKYTVVTLLSREQIKNAEAPADTVLLPAGATPMDLLASTAVADYEFTFQEFPDIVDCPWDGRSFKDGNDSSKLGMNNPMATGALVRLGAKREPIVGAGERNAIRSAGRTFRLWAKGIIDSKDRERFTAAGQAFLADLGIETSFMARRVFRADSTLEAFLRKYDLTPDMLALLVGEEISSRTNMEYRPVDRLIIPRLINAYSRTGETMLGQEGLDLAHPRVQEELRSFALTRMTTENKFNALLPRVLPSSGRTVEIMALAAGVGLGWVNPKTIAASMERIAVLIPKEGVYTIPATDRRGLLHEIVRALVDLGLEATSIETQVFDNGTSEVTVKIAETPNQDPLLGLEFQRRIQNVPRAQSYPNEYLLKREMNYVVFLKPAVSLVDALYRVTSVLGSDQNRANIRSMDVHMDGGYRAIDLDVQIPDEAEIDRLRRELSAATLGYRLDDASQEVRERGPFGRGGASWFPGLYKAYAAWLIETPILFGLLAVARDPLLAFFESLPDPGLVGLLYPALFLLGHVFNPAAFRDPVVYRFAVLKSILGFAFFHFEPTGLVWVAATAALVGLSAAHWKENRQNEGPVFEAARTAASVLRRRSQESGFHPVFLAWAWWRTSRRPAVPEEGETPLGADGIPSVFFDPSSAGPLRESLTTGSPRGLSLGPGSIQKTAERIQKPSRRAFGLWWRRLWVIAGTVLISTLGGSAKSAPVPGEAGPTVTAPGKGLPLMPWLAMVGTWGGLPRREYEALRKDLVEALTNGKWTPEEVDQFGRRALDLYRDDPVQLNWLASGVRKALPKISAVGFEAEMRPLARALLERAEVAYVLAVTRGIAETAIGALGDAPDAWSSIIEKLTGDLEALHRRWDNWSGPDFKTVAAVRLLPRHLLQLLADGGGGRAILLARGSGVRESLESTRDHLSRAFDGLIATPLSEALPMDMDHINDFALADRARKGTGGLWTVVFGLVAVGLAQYFLGTGWGDALTWANAAEGGMLSAGVAGAVGALSHGGGPGWNNGGRAGWSYRRLNNGAEMWTPLGEGLSSVPEKGLIEYVGDKYVVRNEIKYEKISSPVSEINDTLQINLVDAIVERARRDPARPFVVLDWGAGQGQALREIDAALKKDHPDVQNVVLVGLSNVYYSAWETLPKGVAMIYAPARNLAEVIRPESLGLVFSHWSLRSIAGLRWTAYLLDLLPLLSPGGVVYSDIAPSPAALQEIGRHYFVTTNPSRPDLPLLTKPLSWHAQDVGHASLVSPEHPDHNDDAVLIPERDPAAGAAPGEIPGVAVLDGYGRKSSGREASSLVAETFRDWMRQLPAIPSIEQIWIDVNRTISDALGRIQKELGHLLRRSRDEGAEFYPGTTQALVIPTLMPDGRHYRVIAVAVGNTHIFIFNPRDNRLYMVTDGERPHSGQGKRVGESLADVDRMHRQGTPASRGARDEGILLNAIQPGHNPNKNGLAKMFVGVDYHPIDDVPAGSRVLILSDGVHAALSQADLSRLLERHADKSSDQLATLLVEEAQAAVKANPKLSGDDTTAAVLDLKDPGTASMPVGPNFFSLAAMAVTGALSSLGLFYSPDASASWATLAVNAAQPLANALGPLSVATLGALPALIVAVRDRWADKSRKPAGEMIARKAVEAWGLVRDGRSPALEHFPLAPDPLRQAWVGSMTAVGRLLGAAELSVSPAGALAAEARRLGRDFEGMGLLELTGIRLFAFEGLVPAVLHGPGEREPFAISLLDRRTGAPIIGIPADAVAQWRAEEGLPNRTRYGGNALLTTVLRESAKLAKADAEELDAVGLSREGLDSLYRRGLGPTAIAELQANRYRALTSSRQGQRQERRSAANGPRPPWTTCCPPPPSVGPDG